MPLNVCLTKYISGVFVMDEENEGQPTCGSLENTFNLNGVCIFCDLEMGPGISLVTLFCHSPHGTEAKVLLL